MALELYRKKRNFSVTPEPAGQASGGTKKKSNLAFVIQKHQASHLHYDFRLELGGVLLSWAVPKGPSLDPKERRLAMHVEDHPVEYGSFEGVIPPNQYGSGTVLLWDRGTWTPEEEDAASAYEKGKLKFTLDGEKLHGGWTLVRASGGKYASRGNGWFLIKAHDEFAREGDEAHVEHLPLSVASGRSLEQITADSDRQWDGRKSVAENVAAHGTSPSTSDARDDAADAQSARTSPKKGASPKKEAAAVGSSGKLANVVTPRTEPPSMKQATPTKKAASAKKAASTKKAASATKAASAKRAAPAKKPALVKKATTATPATPANKAALAKNINSARNATPASASPTTVKSTPARTPSAAKKTRASTKAAAPNDSNIGADASPTTRPSAAIAGVTLSHPDKQLFPESKLSKRDLALYYAAVADWLLPHIEGRPLTLVRCPNGWSKPCFYQKHAHEHVAQGVKEIEIEEGPGPAMYMMANSIEAVVGLLQMGVLEMHPWGSHYKTLERPDIMVFDFDPDEGLPWSDLVAAVNLLKSLLDKVGLTGFVKTTGGKGLHVVVPIQPQNGWDEIKTFAKAMVDLMVKSFPARFTTSASKAQREGRIFLDYLRNGRGATAIAPYSIRAKANAPVAVPIAWEELATEVRFDHFNVRNVPERVKSLGSSKDPWRLFASTRQSVTAEMMERVGAR